MANKEKKQLMTQAGKKKKKHKGKDKHLNLRIQN
jgi:hypothetical protein